MTDEPWNATYEAGDIVWVDFDPSVGHEQAGRRPALVVSGGDYNSRSSLITVCPITRNVDPWPFKVQLPQGCQIEGAILVDQIKSIDRVRRVVRKGGRVDDETLQAVRDRLVAVVGEPDDK